MCVIHLHSVQFFAVYHDLTTFAILQFPTLLTNFQPGEIPGFNSVFLALLHNLSAFLDVGFSNAAD